jgi:hypothetical protein
LEAGSGTRLTLFDAWTVILSAMAATIILIVRRVRGVQHVAVASTTR